MKRWLAIAALCLLRPSFALTITNTATVDFVDPQSNPQSVNSNTVSTDVLPSPTPAVISYLRYTGPALAGTMVDGSQCYNGSVFNPSPAPQLPNGGGTIDTNNPLSLTPATAFRAGEPIFLQVDDQDKNVDALVREYVEIVLTTSTGDHERLKLYETGQNTGVFVGVLNTHRAPSLSAAFDDYDCDVELFAGTDIQITYQDSQFPTETVNANILIDPYGVLFNSTTGSTINGVKVSIVHAASGLPASVFDDDGTTPYPNEIISGGQVVAGSNTYQMPAGGYRFPLMPAGQYKILLSNVTANYNWPTTIPYSQLSTLINPSTNAPFALNTGYEGSAFTLVDGPPLNIDIPVDSLLSDLVLSKVASKAEVSQGDFIRYELLLKNTGVAQADDVVVTDSMPVGFRFKKGSLKVEGEKVGDPEISTNGRVLRISLGNLAIAANRRISYVTEVTAGAKLGDATNYATATRTNGIDSNQAQVTVKVKSAFFENHAILMGRIFQIPDGDNACSFDPVTDSKKLKGIPKVRILMEDGSYVATDDEGRFHFEKVIAGTHVVQVDENTLPKNLELVACDKNTRFAGRANSQFVDVGGGALWRTDFYVRPKQAPKGMVAVSFKGEVKVPDADSSAEAIYALELTANDKVKNLKIAVKLPADFAYLPMTGNWAGTMMDAQNEGNKLIFRVPALAKGEKGLLTFKAIPQGDVLLIPESCIKEEHVAGLEVNYTVDGFDMESKLSTQSATCSKTELSIKEEGIPLTEKAKVNSDELSVLDDATAAGANRKWTEGELPGIGFLFPDENYNPRAPATRIVIKHGKDQVIDLRVNGEPVSKLNFNYTYNNSEKTVYASEWKGVPLKDGKNKIEASVKDASGNILQILKRDIQFSNIPSHVVFVPEKSRLVANGVDRPRIAVRVLDKDGKPVRRGVTGTFTVNNPYVAAQFEEYAQQKQLSALEKFEPQFTVYTDDGLAFIDLAATNDSGQVKLNFYLDEKKTEEIETWLEPGIQDWVVVGFAEGTAGYKTLKGNMENIPNGGKNETLGFDEEAKLYAKGRVKGDWILTVAYDSTKKKSDKETNFKGIIDPGEFYTLYGDTSTQKKDAASSDKIYLKLEKSRFYALFGDYDAGLNDAELTRYNRSFTGVKSEYSGKFVGFKVFGAQEDGHYYKEEIQGRGESFLYRLANGGILANSEKIRLVIRDRYRSDKIIQDKTLSRQIDYNIDYSGGTVTFKQRIESYVDFNPQFIVVEYETLGAATKDYSYGGRLEGKAMDDKLKVGVVHVHEDSGLENSNLQGVDVKVKIAQQSELVLEGASSNAEPNGNDIKGSAYRAELDHRSKALDANVYAKNTSENYGIGQQAASENGSFKAGAKTSLHVAESLDVNLAHDHQKNLKTEDSQDVSKAELKLKHDSGSVGVGYQRIDEKRAAQDTESNQATANVTQNFFNNSLELQGLVERNLNSDQSVDYPNRYLLQAGYKLTDKTKVFVAQEYTDGNLYDSSTTRVGFESNPWTGSKISSTVNQSVGEAGPRTYSTMGLAQSFVLNKNWSIDAAIDASYTFRESGAAVPVNPSQPLTSGGFLGNGGYTEDYIVTAAGFTYRAEPWSWNFRVEDREGEIEDKRGAVTNVIRELSNGVVLSTSHSYFASDFQGGASGDLFAGDFALAYRPLDSRWTVLDRIKYRYEKVDNAQSLPIFGQNTLQGVDNATSGALVNNFNINRLSKLRRNQFSLYYGAKFVEDQYDGDKYQSFTDMWGLEVRQDLSAKWDVGLQGSVIHSWTANNMKYSFGPSVGWTPVTNSWLSVGYNFRGFYDRDFDAARYTQQGVYLKMRIKFDEKSLGLKK